MLQQQRGHQAGAPKTNWNEPCRRYWPRAMRALSPSQVTRGEKTPIVIAKKKSNAPTANAVAHVRARPPDMGVPSHVSTAADDCDRLSPDLAGSVNIQRSKMAFVTDENARLDLSVLLLLRDRRALDLKPYTSSSGRILGRTREARDGSTQLALQGSSADFSGPVRQ